MNRGTSRTSAVDVVMPQARNISSGRVAPSLLAVGRAKAPAADPDAYESARDTGHNIMSTIIFVGVVVILVVRTMIFKGHPSEFTSMDLPTLEPTKEEEKDPDVYAQDFAPVGNIFRHLARDTEWRKHQENLHGQLLEIAARNFALLDRLPDDAEAEGMSFLDADEKRCHKLVDLLRTAADQAGPNGKHLDACIGVLGEAMPIRIFFNLLLVPSDMEQRQKYYKDRFMALIIALVMALGPAFIIASSWNSEDNVIRQNQAELSIKQVTSTGATEAIGTLLIILIFEFGRTYVVGECKAFDQMKTLPADKQWARLGQCTNMICIFTTMLAMPVIFLCEPYAKDMVFDSMAMLFIFGLDDLGNDILSYLNMDDADFRSKYVTMVRELMQVPVTLGDLVNKNPTDANQIWNVSHYDELTPGAGGEKRLYLERGQLMYSVERNKRTALTSGAFARLVRNMWIVLYYALTVGEVVVPIWFMSVS